MNSLKQYITEKFKLNSKNAKQKLRDVSNCSFTNLDMKLYFKSSQEEKKYNHFIKSSKNKKDADFLKDAELRKLLVYWYLSITNGWLIGSTELKKEIIRRRLFDEDELDAYILSRYKKLFGFEEKEKNMEEYLDQNNIKYEKNERD